MNKEIERIIDEYSEAMKYLEKYFSAREFESKTLLELITCLMSEANEEISKLESKLSQSDDRIWELEYELEGTKDWRED